jgi:hypothetical protein
LNAKGSALPASRKRKIESTPPVLRFHRPVKGQASHSNLFDCISPLEFHNPLEVLEVDSGDNDDRMDAVDFSLEKMSPVHFLHMQDAYGREIAGSRCHETRELIVASEIVDETIHEAAAQGEDLLAEPPFSTLQTKFSFYSVVHQSHHGEVNGVVALSDDLPIVPHVFEALGFRRHPRVHNDIFKKLVIGLHHSAKPRDHLVYHLITHGAILCQ